MPLDQLLVPAPSSSRHATKKVVTIRSIFVWPFFGALFGFFFTVFNVQRPCFLGEVGAHLEEIPDYPLPPPPPPLYDGICDPEIIGEKQPWNNQKKIISYALFAPGVGTTPDDLVPAWAFKGVRFNSENAKTFYPDWVIRLHTVGLSKSDEEVLLQNSNVEILRCKRFHSKARMMMARFLAVDDPNVLYTIVRDLDSRLNFRELMAVNEWIASGLGFHSMRDHRQHVVPIMGCCFGMRRGMFGNATSMTELVRKAITKYPKVVPGCCGDDQSFLSMFVWPRIKSTTMDHDSTPGRGKRYGSKECRDFPSFPRAEEPASNFFVGAAFKLDEYINLQGYTCSHECKAL